jgi:chalcone isomerase
MHGWKGKSGANIFTDKDFFDTLRGDPVEKFIRVVVIKELEGAQYGLQIEMRDCLAFLYKFEEKKELEKLVEFF